MTAAARPDVNPDAVVEWKAAFVAARDRLIELEPLTLRGEATEEERAEHGRLTRFLAQRLVDWLELTDRI